MNKKLVKLFPGILLGGILLSMNVAAQSIRFTIDPSKRAQVIENIGASGAWFSEGIGRYWPSEKKERLAELLFSKGFDPQGNPLGIGLSAWRFNIGGGTSEQGDSSGIRNPLKRVECFLSEDGTYDWNKQSGYLWFVRKAAQYGVENLIAFSNTPPVHYNKNRLGFKTRKDFETNLRDDRYEEYADFLASVLQHFEQENLRFHYISPVNEPQWDWSGTFGQMNQEGSPWQNKDIYRITLQLDRALKSRKLSARILVPEAGILTALYEGNGHASRQIQNFYSKESPFYMGHLKHLKPVIAGHSYFTDNGDSTIISVRQRLKDTAKKYNVPFWQSEYSMLGDGFREGRTGRISAMDCALFLSKMIHHDLVIADATAWHLWNVWEPGNPDFNTRYYLVALKTNAGNTDGDFTITKNLWALGHYSRFIRPGMYRLVTKRNDHLNDLQMAKDVMVSSFTNRKEIVVVAINYTESHRKIDLDIPGKMQSVKHYLTSSDEGDNMKPYPIKFLKNISLKPRSISTFVLKVR